MVLVDGDAISHGKFDLMVDPNDRTNFNLDFLLKRDFEEIYLGYDSFIITHYKPT